jgi:hypothetical protein
MSEIRHATDNGDVNIAVLDDGQLVYICTSCGKTWIGNLTPSGDVDRSVRRSIAADLMDSPLVAFDIDIDSLR